MAVLRSASLYSRLTASDKASAFSGSIAIPAPAFSNTCCACPSTPRIIGRSQAMTSSILVGMTVLNTGAFLSKTRHAPEARMNPGIFSRGCCGIKRILVRPLSRTMEANRSFSAPSPTNRKATSGIDFSSLIAASTTTSSPWAAPMVPM